MYTLAYQCTAHWTHYLFNSTVYSVHCTLEHINAPRIQLVCLCPNQSGHRCSLVPQWPPSLTMSSQSIQKSLAQSLQKSGGVILLRVKLCLKRSSMQCNAMRKLRKAVYWYFVAHRCTIFLCIWDGKYSTGGCRSEMRLQRPKYTKLDLVFCKMSMP